MPFHFAESPTNDLTIDSYDKITRTAEYKVAAARVELAQPVKLICVGGTASGVGKTEVVSLLLKALPGWAAIKVTPCRPEEACTRGDECGACQPPEARYEVVTDIKALYQPGKDTARFIDAGASQVAWVRAIPENLTLGLYAALSQLRNAPGVIIESTTAMPLLNAFRVLVTSPEQREIKESARAIAGLVDVLAVNTRLIDGTVTKFDAQEIAEHLPIDTEKIIPVLAQLPPHYELNGRFIDACITGIKTGRQVIQEEHIWLSSYSPGG